MKKLLFLLGALLTIAATPAYGASSNNSYSYTNSFIFIEGGIEFAVFPDGQLDFNYLDYGPNFNTRFNSAAVNVSFNTGFNYDRFVQYDAYGAVVQVYNVPVFYDSFGRVIQIGDVFINYRRGWVNRIGGLRINYTRPGFAWRTRGFINPFNRFYVARPWHSFYAVPFSNRCVVFTNPYRRFYNPIRYNWAYHRSHWNSPYYLNNRTARSVNRHGFYRPGQRVAYHRFERGTRNNRGRAIAISSDRSARNAIATGRRTVNQINSRSVRTTSRMDRNELRATSNRLYRSSNTIRNSSRNAHVSTSTPRGNRNFTSRGTSSRNTNVRATSPNTRGSVVSTNRKSRSNDSSRSSQRRSSRRGR